MASWRCSGCRWPTKTTPRSSACCYMRARCSPSVWCSRICTGSTPRPRRSWTVCSTACPLPPASADVLLAAILGHDPSLEPLKRLLIACTQGNLFFLEESVRTLVETGVLVGERGAYGLAQALPTMQVPATVQAVLAARIDRLPPEDKRLLQTAAVVGT